MKHASNTRQKTIGWALHAAGLASVALVLGTYYGLGYARLVDQSETNATRAEQLGKLLETSTAVQRKHQSLRQELKALERAVVTTHGRLPQELHEEEFENSVRLVATDVGFNLEDSNWDTPRSTPTHSQAEVTVSGAGSFASICRFLDEINQLPRITKISKLKLETDPKFDSYPLQVTFVLVYGIESHDTDKKGGVL